MNLSITLVLFFITTAQSILTDEECIRLNNKTLPNNFLRGVWYDILEFNPNPSPSFCDCPTSNYTSVSEQEIIGFKQKYKDFQLPFSFDSKPVRYNRFYGFRGIFAGETEVKFYVLDPDDTGRLQDDLPYMTIVHNKINDNFVLRYRCVFDRAFVYLMSKKRYPTDKEINCAVKKLPKEVRRLNKVRHCCPVVHTTSACDLL